jgi:hypothetical protein
MGYDSQLIGSVFFGNGLGVSCVSTRVPVTDNDNDKGTPGVSRARPLYGSYEGLEYLVNDNAGKATD